MLIKIDNERYINSDHLIGIDFDHDRYILHLTGGNDIPTTSDVVTYIVEVLDANTGFTQEAVAPLSLASRIAIWLKNRDGLCFAYIVEAFAPETPADINLALAELIQQNVVAVIDDTYYHASNPMLQTGISSF